ncbi:hypothetical protein, partial [Cyanobacterium aponinum]|uniref:hypothetical protein n=1 Tax=Cyanobacterium aponinum TaxID=379064 RepID=UPI000C13BC29
KIYSYPNLILKSDNISDTVSKIIEDSEKLLTHSVSDSNLLPTSEKLEGLVTQLLSEERNAIPTFSEDLNYLLNGGFSRGRFYVI